MTPERVVLVHGLGRTRWSMALLGARLKRAGFDPWLWGYPSRSGSIVEHARRLASDVAERTRRDPASRTHFVTHSLGGMVVRYAYTHFDLDRSGRCVQLSPPNRGAWLADRVSSSSLARWILGPALTELRTDGIHAECGIPPVDFGILIGGTDGSRGRGFWIPGDNDGLVKVQEARLDGMRDFRVVRSFHTWIMNRRETARRVGEFLRTGRFAERPGG